MHENVSKERNILYIKVGLATCDIHTCTCYNNDKTNHCSLEWTNQVSGKWASKLASNVFWLDSCTSWEPLLLALLLSCWGVVSCCDVSRLLSWGSFCLMLLISDLIHWSSGTWRAHSGMLGNLMLAITDLICSTFSSGITCKREACIIRRIATPAYDGLSVIQCRKESWLTRQFCNWLRNQRLGTAPIHQLLKTISH